MALITCENVSIGYEGQTVVKELNFSIERGDYLCIVGENGSGKSTLVKSLLGCRKAKESIASLHARCRKSFPIKPICLAIVLTPFGKSYFKV